jgi:hypothetical protein
MKKLWVFVLMLALVVGFGSCQTPDEKKEEVVSLMQSARKQGVAAGGYAAKTAKEHNELAGMREMDSLWYASDIIMYEAGNAIKELAMTTFLQGWDAGKAYVLQADAPKSLNDILKADSINFLNTVVVKFRKRKT